MSEFQRPEPGAVSEVRPTELGSIGLPAELRGGAELVALCERVAESLPSALHLQTDRLTGMYLKNLLFSEAGRALIEGTIPGPKRFVLLDCQHAGAANSHGAEEQLNRYFASLRGLFERAALEVGIPHVPIRLGGDEFALVIPADERSSRFLRRIVVEVERSRGEHLGPGTNELGTYVVERDTMRTIRGEYRRETERHHQHFSAPGFFEYMRDTFVPRGDELVLSRGGFERYLQNRGIAPLLSELRREPAREELAHALEAGYLQKYIANALISGMTAPAGRFSMSAVDIGAHPRWEDYHLAEGVAAKRIQATKERVFTVDIEPVVSVNPHFVVKHHESAACRAFVEREEAYAELRKSIDDYPIDPGKRATDLQRIVMLAVADPNLPGAVRGDLIREIPSAVVLQHRFEGSLYALAVNVSSFGVVNNSKSYADADRMLADVVSCAANDFPPLALVRQGGGRVVLIGTKPLGIDDVVRIRGALEGRVEEHLRGDGAAYQRILVEYGERYALNSRWQGGEFIVPPLDFGRCSVGIAVVKIDPTAPLDLGNM